MDHNKTQPDRKIDSAERSSSSEKDVGRESLKEHQELKEAAKNFVDQMNDGTENNEILNENSDVAEQMGEDKKTGPAGNFKGGPRKTATIPTPPPVVKMPKIEIMRAQVAKAIKREIHHLEKKAKKMVHSPTGFQPFNLNTVVSKIRELKEILAMVTYATFETLKGWWFKFVKGS